MISSGCVVTRRYKEFLSSKRQNEYFLQCCLERLTFRCYAPGTFLYRQGDKLRELILVKSGRVDILVHGNVQALLTLVTGDYTGDFQLMFGTPAEFAAQANGYLETMVLTWDIHSCTCSFWAWCLGLSRGLKWGCGVRLASSTSDDNPDNRTSFWKETILSGGTYVKSLSAEG